MLPALTGIIGVATITEADLPGSQFYRRLPTGR
jgi:hypothetical protein